jgi:HEAT repeat protein
MEKQDLEMNDDGWSRGRWTTEADVRAAVVRGPGKLLMPRMFDLMRRALNDPAPAVVDAALQLLRKTEFVGALPSLMRIFREWSDEKVRLAVLVGIGINLDRTGAARALLDFARQETGAVRKAAEETLAKVAKVGGEEVAALLRQARDIEAGDQREVLDRMLRPAVRV